MRSVVKHSYLKGVSKVARASAHVNYIQYRSGDDRGKEPRPFYCQDRDRAIQGREVKKELHEHDIAGKVVHKMILSPGMEGIDVERYTRAVMTQLGREKGLDLNWRAITHNNTDHPHAHVIIFGKDLNGKEVVFRRPDYIKAREFGDRFIERNYNPERFQDRQMHRVLNQPYERDGDEKYLALVKELQDHARDSDTGDAHYERLKAELKNQRQQEFDAWSESKGRPKEERGPSSDEAKPPEATNEKTAKPYKEKAFNLDVAIRKLPAEEKIQYEGRTYSKFDKLEDLEQFREDLKERPFDEWIPKEEFGQIGKWVTAKRELGDDCYEKKARERWERREKARKDGRPPGEDEREFSKLDRDIRKSLRDTNSGGSGEYISRGHKERLRQTQGRLGAEHGHAGASQELGKLNQQLENEADPAKRQEIEAKIGEIKAWDLEQSNQDNPARDLDTLLGDRYDRDLKQGHDLLKPLEKEPKMREPEPLKDPERAPEKHEGPIHFWDGPIDKKNELDQMLGEKFSRGEYDERQVKKEVEHQQGQQEQKQAQDLHNSMFQKPELELDEPARDDGEDFFARGER